MHIFIEIINVTHSENWLDYIFCENNKGEIIIMEKNKDNNMFFSATLLPYKTAKGQYNLTRVELKQIAGVNSYTIY